MCGLFNLKQNISIIIIIVHSQQLLVARTTTIKVALKTWSSMEIPKWVEER